MTRQGTPVRGSLSWDLNPDHQSFACTHFSCHLTQEAVRPEQDPCPQGLQSHWWWEGRWEHLSHITGRRRRREFERHSWGAPRRVDARSQDPGWAAFASILDLFSSSLSPASRGSAQEELRLTLPPAETWVSPQSLCFPTCPAIAVRSNRWKAWLPGPGPSELMQPAPVLLCPPFLPPEGGGSQQALSVQSPSGPGGSPQH